MSKDSKFPTGIEFINYKKVKPFWTKREYQYQQLVINGFAVQRETLPNAQYERGKEAIPKARIDIYYDTGKGIGSKKINGYEIFVYKEAIEFLDPGEKAELDKKWKQAYVSGHFDYDDPYCKKDLVTSHLLLFHLGFILVELIKKIIHQQERQQRKKIGLIKKIIH